MTNKVSEPFSSDKFLPQSNFYFHLLDKGYLEIEEFKSIIKEIEPDLPEDELDQFVHEVDSDGSGKIEFEEFLEMMVGA